MTRADASKTKPGTRAEAPVRKETNRDFIEQIVVAFILAFLVRGFEAEAFVIPTGSMATTLMGRHKEVVCPQCGQVYQVNASSEPGMPMQGPPPIESGVCGNCRFRNEHLADAPSFKGDRILVNKFLYAIPALPGGGGPNRWDVVVFHYPEEPETNYIKRCVGLPNEELRVSFGDLWTRPLGAEAPFRIQRKPLRHQQSMQIPVWDDAHRPRAFAKLKEWRRWSSPDWTEPTDGIYEAAAGPPGAWRTLRYRHLVPDPKQWDAVLSGRDAGKPRATLITDFYAYNTAEVAPAGRRFDRGGWYTPHWVGDLTVSCNLRIEPPETGGAPTGKVRLELIEGGIANRCEIDVATGQAVLYHGEQMLGSPAPTSMTVGAEHSIRFANVDDRLTLWVDGRIPFGDGLEYNDANEVNPLPTDKDLEPVAIATDGPGLRVSGLVLSRDIYYTLVPGGSDYGDGYPWEGTGFSNYDSNDPDRRVVELFDRLADPSQLAELKSIQPKDYIIRPGHYMMMGDNSPCSKDSRGWSQADQLRSFDPDWGWDPNLRESWEVPEALLIGKAFYIYWPHGKPIAPNIRITRDFRLPFRPYVERMKWIR